ncbi:lysine 5,6-aminomutase reactivase subunit KamB [Guggenheimella bovis]
MLKNSLSSIRRLSVIGLGKNTGKTTFVNYLLDFMQKEQPERVLFLTSIGYDGESVDVVTQTSKPRIWIRKGTLIATAREVLKKFDVTYEVVKTSGISSALGEIIITRALDDGFVQIAGPSQTAKMKELLDQVEEIEPDAFMIVDGALSRKSLAGHELAEACVLCTGAVIARSMEGMIRETVHALHILSLPEIDSKGSFHMIDPNEFDGQKKIFFDGVVTEKVMQALIKHVEFKDLTLFTTDPTHYFLTEETLHKLEKRSIHLGVEKGLKILLISVNPTSPTGDVFPSEELVTRLQQLTHLPVIDVKGGIHGKHRL